MFLEQQQHFLSIFFERKNGIPTYIILYIIYIYYIIYNIKQFSSVKNNYISDKKGLKNNWSGFGL